MGEKLKIAPDISLVNKIRKVDLEIPEAISELVANSLDARKPGQSDLTIRIGLEELNGQDYLFILDNANGMTKDELEKALSLGKTSKGTQHKGVYGLGLKTASGVIGNKIIIETTTQDTGNVHHAVYDIDKITAGKKWEVPYRNPERQDSLFFKRKFHSGTAILITSLNRPTDDIHWEPIKTFLSLAFKPHIEKGDKIYVNQTLVKPYEYDLYDFTKEPVRFRENNISVEGWIGILKVGQKKVNIASIDALRFGVCVYRKGQLVEAFYKGFLSSQHRQYGNVIGEISVDPLTVNYTKKGVSVTDPNWKIVVEEMKERIKKYAKASVKLTTKTVRGEIIDKEKQVINMYKALNKKPDGTTLDKYFPIDDPSFEYEDDDNDPLPSEQKTEKQNPLSLLENNIIRISDNEIEVVFIPHSDHEAPWKWYSTVLDSDILNIYLNKEFRIFKEATNNKEKKMLYVLALATQLQKIIKQNKSKLSDSFIMKCVYEWVNENYDRIRIPG